MYNNAVVDFNIKCATPKGCYLTFFNGNHSIFKIWHTFLITKRERVSGARCGRDRSIYKMFISTHTISSTTMQRIVFAVCIPTILSRKNYWYLIVNFRSKIKLADLVDKDT